MRAATGTTASHCRFFSNALDGADGAVSSRDASPRTLVYAPVQRRRGHEGHTRHDLRSAQPREATAVVQATQAVGDLMQTYCSVSAGARGGHRGEGMSKARGRGRSAAGRGRYAGRPLEVPRRVGFQYGFARFGPRPRLFAEIRHGPSSPFEPSEPCPRETCHCGARSAVTAVALHKASTRNLTNSQLNQLRGSTPRD